MPVTVLGEHAVTLPAGTTEQRPTGVVGMVRFNTTLQALENFTVDGWFPVSVPIPTLASVAGGIFSGTPSTLTLTGTNFGIAAGSVRFTASGVVTNVAVTPASATSATVAVPSAVFNLSVGVSVDVQFVNSDNGVSNIISKTIAALPTGGTITTSGEYRIHTFSTQGSYSFVVDQSSIDVEIFAWGAGGTGGSSQGSGYSGGAGGGGGFIKANLNSLGANTYNVLVGQSIESNDATVVRAFGGGGNGGARVSQRIGGTGGGRSEFSIGGGSNTPAGTRILVAGGGGGGNALYSAPSSENPRVGGAGGGTTGGSGSGSGTPPTGGTQSSGGNRGTGLISISTAYQSTAGIAGIGGYATGGNIAIDVSYGAGGGGGGGFFGGGGGDGGDQNTNAQSGGGGSSYANTTYATNITNTQASGSTPPGTGESVYVSGRGLGSAGKAGVGPAPAGGSGLIVIRYIL